MKYAVCNELFASLPLESSCNLAARYGFTGLELAPYTLAESPRDIGSAARAHIRSALAATGLKFVGLHWLLIAPEGLHLTTPERKIRTKSWDFMRYLIELCAELGGGVMVLGSGKKRNASGIRPESAWAYLKEGLQALAPFAEQGHTKILVEPLSASITDTINTLSEAEDLIGEVDNPAVSGIFDFHNCTEETLSWPQLINRFRTIITHVHLNEVDGGYPGSGASDFLPAFNALKKIDFPGWVSLEVFDQDKPPEIILKETARFISDIEDRLQADT